MYHTVMAKMYHTVMCNHLLKLPAWRHCTALDIGHVEPTDAGLGHDGCTVLYCSETL